MKISPLILMLLMSACSSNKGPGDPGLRPIRYSSNDIETCRQYQREVLDSSYKEIKANDDIVIVFNHDVNQARASFENFDVRKGLIEIKGGLIENILRSCDEASLRQFDQDYKNLAGCQLMFSELRYFQSLASALNRYPWPMALKLEGKKVALDYVRFFADGKYPLLNRLIALSVLDELSVNQVVNRDLHSQIKHLMEDARKYVGQLQKKVTKRGSLSCEDLDIMSEELIYSEEVAKKMQGFLKQI